jgi:hypothetical protein
VYTLGEFWVPKIHGGRLHDFLEGGVFRRWWRARSSVCARKAGASVNGISRKQQRLRACSGRAGVNGRARKHAFVCQILRSACVVADWWLHLTPFLAQSSSTRKLKADTETQSRQIGVE